MEMEYSFVSQAGQSVHFKRTEQDFWLVSLFGLLCDPVENGANRFYPIKPAVIRTNRDSFNAANFTLLTVVVEEYHFWVTWRVGRGGVALETEWRFDPEESILSRRDTLSNRGRDPATILRWLASISLQPGDYEIYSQSSRWATENQGKWAPLNSGTISLGCEEGRTSQGSTPYACLRLISSRQGLAIHLLPLGNWTIKFRPVTYHQGLARLDLEAGQSDEALRYLLNPGEQWTAPELLFQPLPTGQPEDAASSLHRYANQRWFLQGRKDLPVAYNTWLDRFDLLDPARLEAQLSAAKEVGCDVFVVDAGWFGSEPGAWFESTGDWHEKPDGTFHGNLKGFAHKVRSAGLGFGLWMEPEHFGRKAPLREQHPDWFLGGKQAGNPCFDLENPLAYAHIEVEIRRLIETYQLAWIKLDFNILLGMDEHGTEFHHYHHCLFNLLDNLRRNYPQVAFEGCSSGGMRLELEALQHFDFHFLSDNVNPYDALRIGEGALLRLPPGRLGRWSVGWFNDLEHVVAFRTDPDRREAFITAAAYSWGPAQAFETIDLDFLALVAFPGILGYSGDLSGLPQKARDRLAEHTAFYKKWRRWLIGAYAHLLTPVRGIQERDGWIVWQLCRPGDTACLVMAYRLQDIRPRQRIRLYDLIPDRGYTIRFYPDGEKKLQANGRGLMADGLEIELVREGSARIYILE
jgi:alpha-galactosidase